MPRRSPVIVVSLLSVIAVAVGAASCGGGGSNPTPTSPTTPPVTTTPTPTTGTLSGTVTDASNGSALANAAVAVGSRSATTGADGRYSLSDLPLGSAAVTVQRQGYRNVSTSVTVVAGTNTSNQMMTPAFAAGFAGNWSGTWRNTTFGSTGGATAAVTVNTIAQTITIAFDMSGNVFGRSDPPSETFTFPYTLTGGTFTGTSPNYGTITLTSTATGAVTGNVVNPAPSISRVDFTSSVTPTTFTGACTITFSGGGGTAAGTMTLTRQGGASTASLLWTQVVSKVRTWLG